MPVAELGRHCLEERLGIDILEGCGLVSEQLCSGAAPCGLVLSLMDWQRAACPEPWILMLLCTAGSQLGIGFSSC